MVRGVHGNYQPNSLAFEHIDSARGNWQKGQPRIFKETIDHHEREALQYILENLTKKSLIKLIPLRRKLNDKGSQIDHLHPLAFFLGILTNHPLKDHFHRLRRKNNRAWVEFVSGVTNSFKDEKRHNNLQDSQIESFCRILGKDPHHLRHLIHIENWKEIIRHL